MARREHPRAESRGTRRGTRQAPVLITDAKRTPSADRRIRAKRYAWLQGIRIPLLVLAICCYFFWDQELVAAGLILVSVPLPWLAVVVANARGEPRDPRRRQVYKPGAACQWAAEHPEALSGRASGALGAGGGEPDPQPGEGPGDVIDGDEDSGPRTP